MLEKQPSVAEFIAAALKTNAKEPLSALLQTNGTIVDLSLTPEAMKEMTLVVKFVEDNRRSFDSFMNNINPDRSFGITGR